VVRLSLRARVLAGLALIVVALGVAAVAVTTTTREHLIDQIDSRLAVASDLAGRAHGPDEEKPPTPPPGFDDRLSDVFEGLLSGDGELDTWFSPNYGDDEAVPPPDIDPARAADAAASREPFTVDAVGDDDLRYRVVARPGYVDGYWITAIPLTDVEDTVSRLIIVEVVATGIILLLLAAVGWWVVRLGIRPIKQMTRTAEAIASGDMSHRVPELPASTEAGQLGAALNHMLERLDEAFTEREESQQRLRRFVADASHELRTPVTTIRGYAELYRVGGLTDRDHLDEAMRRTEQEAVRMTRLVDDLLNLAKLDQGRPLERVPLDVTRLVADAARDAAAVDPQRSISAELDGPAVVAGDEDRLRQVIANIVGNALVHTSPTTPIELRVSGDASVARIEVTDHGAGMPPDVAARVTQRFYRADPARARERGGSGLGMSIADAAVSAHGGEIVVDSEVGRGTTVTVTLPLAMSSDNSQVGAGES
jgi:two-component system, OmpR family, sensor kinase